jgi:hypothetical protein
MIGVVIFTHEFYSSLLKSHRTVQFDFRFKPGNGSVCGFYGEDKRFSSGTRVLRHGSSDGDRAFYGTFVTAGLVPAAGALDTFGFCLEFVIIGLVFGPFLVLFRSLLSRNMFPIFLRLLGLSNISDVYWPLGQAIRAAN